jgi:hypothetical protein
VGAVDEEADTVDDGEGATGCWEDSEEEAEYTEEVEGVVVVSEREVE